MRNAEHREKLETNCRQFSLYVVSVFLSKCHGRLRRPSSVACDVRHAEYFRSECCTGGECESMAALLVNRFLAPEMGQSRFLYSVSAPIFLFKDTSFDSEKSENTNSDSCLHSEIFQVTHIKHASFGTMGSKNAVIICFIKTSFNTTQNLIFMCM